MILTQTYATIDDAISRALEAIEPYVKQGYTVHQDDEWGGDLGVKEKKAITHPLFEGNDYWYMTEAEKLKSTLTAIFKRKGHDGRYTRLFENLEPSQRDALLKEVSLHAGELPVIGSAESQDTWLIVTTARIVWRLNGKTQTLSVHDVWHVKADLPKMVATGVRKHQLRELQIETLAHEQRTVEVEEGAPLMGVWNALMNLGARNRRTEKEQSKAT